MKTAEELREIATKIRNALDYAKHTSLYDEAVRERKEHAIAEMEFFFDMYPDILQYTEDPESFIKEMRSTMSYRFFPFDAIEAAFAHELPDYIGFPAGCTRGVLLLDDEDYVIKFPLSEEDSHYNVTEAEVYEDAVEEGFDSYFAECQKLMKYDFNREDSWGLLPILDITIMERCDVDDDAMSEEVYSTLSDSDEYSDIDREDVGDSDTMFIYAGTVYGEQAIDDLECFLDDRNINDCHSGNWGWLGGRLVLTDYAGY